VQQAQTRGVLLLTNFSAGLLKSPDLFLFMISGPSSNKMSWEGAYAQKI